MLKHLSLIFIVFISQNIFASDLKGQNFLNDGVDQYYFYIKIKSDFFPDLENGKVRFFSKSKTVNPFLINDLNEFSFKQVMPLTNAQRAEVRSGVETGNTEESFDKKLFSGLLEFSETTTMNKHELLSLANKLEGYDEVEYCEVSPFDSRPTHEVISQDSTSLTQTPDFSDMQIYKEGNHGGDTIGIYAEYAWGLGIKGEGIQVADVEWGWNYDREDLAGPNFIDGLTTTDHLLDEHGTAVAGVIFAKDNGIGVTGMAHEAENFTGYSVVPKGRTAAIGLALENLNTGDVLMYELQRVGPAGEVVPADFSQSVWDLTKAASDAGVIVVAAAGNGSQNLDGNLYTTYMNRGDNGSIMVGAATTKGRNKIEYSNYGTRVNISGWGNLVTTTGYGAIHYGGPNSTYTIAFGGTSAATPIAASAVILVQSYYKKIHNKILTPIEMRELLIETGTPQGTGGSIGPLPNVQAAILRLDELHATSIAQTKTNIQTFAISVKNNQLIFQVPNSTSSNIEIVLYSITGTQMGSYQASNIRGTHSIPISSIVQLNTVKGIYLARLKSGDISKHVKFLIK